MKLKGLFLICALLLQACGSADSPPPSPRPNLDREKALSIRPGYKVGVPYVINGKRYVPEERFSYSATGTASWYGDYFHGRLTANGEIFDMNAMTAAHKTLQLPAVVRVKNTENRRALFVRVNDRGPFVSNRLIDLSKGAARSLGFFTDGLAPVRVDVDTRASRILRDMARKRASVKEMDAFVAELNANGGSKPVREVAVKPVQSAKGNWFLKAAKFRSLANAGQATKALRDLGEVSIAQRSDAGQDVYVVRLGPYDDKREAQSALVRVHKVGFDDAIMVGPS